MAVLNTTSPTVVPTLPMELPIKTVPSASARMAGGKAALRDESTGISEMSRVARNPQKRILQTAVCEGFALDAAGRRFCGKASHYSARAKPCSPMQPWPPARLSGTQHTTRRTERKKGHRNDDDPFS